MGDILSRIQKISINEGINITSMEKIIGASKGVLSRAIKQGTDIQSKWIKRIAEEFPRYSLDWLLKGDGNMLKDAENSNTENFLNEKEGLYNVKPECEYNATTPAKSAVLDRITLFVENSQLSKKAFADAINMEQSTVNNQLIGKRGLSIDLILSFLSSYSNISAEWLLRGRGDMYICNHNEASTNISYDGTTALKEEIIRLKAENGVLREVVGINNIEKTKVGGGNY